MCQVQQDQVRLTLEACLLLVVLVVGVFSRLAGVSVHAQVPSHFKPSGREGSRSKGADLGPHDHFDVHVLALRHSLSVVGRFHREDSLLVFPAEMSSC